jgi:hypothetical protein
MNAPLDCMAPPQAMRRLAEFLSETGSMLSPTDAATMAINQWIAFERGQLTATAPTPTRGYQWKALFLPAGTELRISFGGDYFYARVEGDAIIYRGRAVSPRQMALAVAGEGRNAWREIWILPPGERKWYPASLLRRQASEQEPPEPASPLDAMSAAAACMSETLKTALALVEQANSQALQACERRVPRHRRAADSAGEGVAFDD